LNLTLKSDLAAGDKWTAFVLSLVVPGAGQLYARRWSCLAWFLTAALTAALTTWAAPALGVAAGWVRFPALVLLGVASAEHAKRCLELRAPRRPGAAGVSTCVSCGCGHGRAVDLRIDLEAPSPLAAVWAFVADFRRFACIDPFHERVVVLGPALRPGVQLVLEHCAFGVRFPRFGRLLRWDEGHGYAFSDLSARGPTRGFPHVFFVSVTPAGGTEHTRLTVRVRGKWTARFVPLWAGRWWLRYVCKEHARLLRAALAEVGP
jgi:hypothetical protein